MSEFYIPTDIDVLKIDLTEHDKQIRADERAKVLDDVWDAFKNEWTLDSLASHENKYEILAIIKRQIEQIKEQTE